MWCSTIQSLSLANATRLVLLLTLIHPAASSAKFAEDADSCKVIGDADVYGLGIRLNFYLQWAAIIFATWIAPEQVNIGRQLSHIVAISVYTNTFTGAKNGSLIVAEWWIVYFMTFVLILGFLPVSTMLKWKSVNSLGFLGLLWCMIVFAECWLWFKGVDNDQKDGCVVKVFLFLEVNVDNEKWRTVFQVGSVISCVAATAFLLFSLRRIWNMRKKSDEETRPGSIESDNMRIMEEKANLNILKAGLTIFQLIFGGFSILQIEMTMKINHIDVSATPLTSSGQLIAFVGGVYALVAVFAIGIKNLMTK